MSIIIQEDLFFSAISDAKIKLTIPETALIKGLNVADDPLYAKAPDHWVWYLRQGTHIPAVGHQLGIPHLSRRGWNDNIERIKLLYADAVGHKSRRKLSWVEYSERVEIFFDTVERDTEHYINNLQMDLDHLKAQIK